MPYTETSYAETACGSRIIMREVRERNAKSFVRYAISLVNFLIIVNYCNY